jgi:hypothetical protein
MLNSCNEQGILFKITNGKYVFTNISDKKRNGHETPDGQISPLQFGYYMLIMPR